KLRGHTASNTWAGRQNAQHAIGRFCAHETARECEELIRLNLQRPCLAVIAERGVELSEIFQRDTDAPKRQRQAGLGIGAAWHVDLRAGVRQRCLKAPGADAIERRYSGEIERVLQRFFERDVAVEAA